MTVFVGRGGCGQVAVKRSKLETPSPLARLLPGFASGGDAGAEGVGARDDRVPGRDVPDVVAHASMFRGSVSNALTRCVGSSKRRVSSAIVVLVFVGCVVAF